MAETNAKVRKSPVGKLVQFFERSRDRWKEKYQRLKAKCKQLSNQVRAVENSREQWRELAQQRLQRIRELEQQLAQQKKLAA